MLQDVEGHNYVEAAYVQDEQSVWSGGPHGLEQIGHGAEPLEPVEVGRIEGVFWLVGHGVLRVVWLVIRRRPGP